MGRSSSKVLGGNALGQPARLVGRDRNVTEVQLNAAGSVRGREQHHETKTLGEGAFGR